jgi:hypothetical protein
VTAAAGRVVISLLFTLALSNAGAQSNPTLRYAPPPNFYRSAITPPEDYTSNEFNASMQIYPFRPFTGNIEQMFQRTMLREWIDPRYREASVTAQPLFGRSAIQGAQAVYTARFAENVVGIPRQRMRMLIVAGNSAAIVDATAVNDQVWQRAVPALNAMAATLRVEAGQAVPSIAEGPGPAGKAVAGLYMGSKPKYMVNLNRAVGQGSHVLALHYYLLSPNGRVYRAYDQIQAPGGDVSRFDFDAAQRADPVNSGRYTIKSNQLHIQFIGQPPETISVPAPQGGRVTIDTVLYIRQQK